MTANKSQVRFLFTLLAVVWGFLVATNALLAAWSNPTATPPGSNPEPFISTNNTSQTKAGVLTIANNFYVNGSGTTGKVGIGTTTTATSARLMVAPYTNASIDAGDGFIRTNYHAVDGTDVVNKNYLESTLGASLDPVKYWILSGTKLYASSTSWQVGIGTTNPSSKLEIVADNTYAPVKISRTNNNKQIGISYYPAGALSNTNKAWIMGVEENSNNFSFYNWNGTAINDVLYLTDKNNIGIGTTSPTSRLTIVGSGITSTTSALNIQNSSGSSILFVRNDGFVGIGTTSPTAPLYINGNAIADTPLLPNHLATKSYVDTAAQSLWINNGNYLYASSTSWRVGIGTTSPRAALHIYPKAAIEGLRIVSSDYSPLVIRNTADTGDLFRVTQTGDVTAVTSSATKMRSDQYCDASGNNCFNPSSGSGSVSYFATVTSATYNGSNNGTPGYAYAHGRCQAQLAGSHVCSAEEMLNTIRDNQPMPTVDVWILNGPPGYTAMANDCDGRRSAVGSGTNVAYSAGWQMSDSNYLPHGRGLLYTCEKSMKFACCK